jgi:hypothetical protein
LLFFDGLLRFALAISTVAAEDDTLWPVLIVSEEG